jgi:hypothetical protein
MRIWTIAVWMFVLTASGCCRKAMPSGTYQLSVDGGSGRRLFSGWAW